MCLPKFFVALRNICEKIAKGCNEFYESWG